MSDIKRSIISDNMTSAKLTVSIEANRLVVPEIDCDKFKNLSRIKTKDNSIAIFTIVSVAVLSVFVILGGVL